ncbi:MAG: Spy/CpxP family protein refolding chaperone [Hyphomicrobiaceae bacterium]
MLNKSLRNVAFASLVALSSVSPAMAEEDDNDWRPSWGMGRMMQGMMGMDADDMSERIEGRLAFIKAELKITEAQTPAWNALADLLRNTAETRRAMMASHREEMRDGSFFKKPLPDRLTFMETMMSAHLEEVKSIKAAVNELYGTLSDDQKKEADSIVLPMMGMGMMGRGRGMGGGMMMSP